MAKGSISPAQASIMRAFKDRVPTDQEIEMQNMDDAQARVDAAQAAKIAQAEQAAKNEQDGHKSLWGFGKSAPAQQPADISNFTPEQLLAYWAQQKKQGK